MEKFVTEISPDKFLVDKTTGEIEEYQRVIKVSEPAFVKIYVDYYCSFQLRCGTDVDKDVLWAAVSVAVHDTHNDALMFDLCYAFYNTLNSIREKPILKQQVNRSLKKFIEYGAIKKVSDGLYEINPELACRTSIAKRNKLIFEYNGKQEEGN